MGRRSQKAWSRAGRWLPWLFAALQVDVDAVLVGDLLEADGQTLIGFSLLLGSSPVLAW